MAIKPLCSIPDCCKARAARGLCNAHYQRWRRHGGPLNGSTYLGEPERYLKENVLTYDGDECLTWPFTKSQNGYGQLHRGGRKQIVSRMVCEEVNGPPPTPEHQAAHSCGKGHEACVTKGHLSWKTRSDNKADELTHGTRVRGERQNSAKLTTSSVREIRSLRGIFSQREIAAKFNVNQTTVGQIHLRRIWGWLE
jgi:hypothetical protein